MYIYIYLYTHMFRIHQDFKLAVLYLVTAGSITPPEKMYKAGQRRRAPKREKSDFASSEALKFRCLLYHIRRTFGNHAIKRC